MLLNKDISIEFYDSKMTCVGVMDADEMESLTWIRRFRGIGEFMIDCKYVKNLKACYTLGTYVMRNDANYICYITDYSITKNSEGYRAYLHGYEVTNFLAKRINKFRSLEKNPVIYVQHLIKNNLTESTDQARRINLDVPWVVDFSTIPNRPNSIEVFSEFENVFDAVMTFGRMYGFGLKMEYKNGKMQLRFPREVNRTDAQAVNKPLFFTEDIGNVVAFNVAESSNDNFNMIYVSGKSVDETTGAETRYLVEVGDGVGTARREMVMIAGEKEYDERPQAYRDRLENEGREELAKNYIQFQINVETANNVFKYPWDWDLGDIATIETEIFEGDGLISEITEIFDSNGYAVFPTFEFDTRTTLITESGNILTTEDGDNIAAQGGLNAD